MKFLLDEERRLEIVQVEDVFTGIEVCGYVFVYVCLFFPISAVEGGILDVCVA